MMRAAAAVQRRLEVLLGLGLRMAWEPSWVDGAPPVTRSLEITLLFGVELGRTFRSHGWGNFKREMLLIRRT